MRLARQELREEARADAVPLVGRLDVELDHLEVRRVEPLRTLRGREGARHMVGPPLAVRAAVPVAEADQLVSCAGDEEDEVVAGRVARQPVGRPLVGQRARAERRAMDLAQLRLQGQRVGQLDCDGQGSSTVTWVTGSANRSRAFSTMPRSSQCERPGGCVETISSSGRNVRSASSIA